MYRSIKDRQVGGLTVFASWSIFELSYRRIDIEMEVGVIQCIMGIDPGASGAIAFYYPEFPSRIGVYDCPVVDGEINAVHLAELIKTHEPELAVIESVGPMPKQGVSSTFKFGVAYGMARGVVSALLVPQMFVTPAKWKKHYSLSAEKEKARELAINTWPSCGMFTRKKDHGRAEAALLAKYGAAVTIKN